MVVFALFASFGSISWAQGVPKRQIPPSVLAEVQLLENRFEIALAMDCAPDRCFPKGCTYVDHAVTDQPRGGSLPGLTLDDWGPGSVPVQEYLTRAKCAFAHEASIDKEDVQALTRRLQAKVSKGWTVVSVTAQPLPELPGYLLDDEPEPLDTDVPEPEPEPEPVPEPFGLGMALHQLWNALLPHFFWMIGLGLLTLATVVLIWAFRRVGARTLEEEALLAELTRGEGGEPPPPTASEATSEATEAEDDEAFAARQLGAWQERLSAMDPAAPDPEITALIRLLLRSGDLPLLATAVLTFPDSFPAAFPRGGQVASAKLELAEYLKNVDADSLQPDATFFRALNRHALSATLVSQDDAEVVRGLREDFGAAGLVELIGRLPARPAALLFALAPATEQPEMVRLLTPNQTAHLSEQLLRSNRMDDAETHYLFEVLQAVRNGTPFPDAPRGNEVSDRGQRTAADAALSVLLPSLDGQTRSALFQQVVQQFNGSVPAWYRTIFYPDLLFALDDESRADLLLAVDVEKVAAWVSLLPEAKRSQVLATVPDSLRNALRASSVFPSRERQLELAEQGRRDLAAGFQRLLAQRGVGFERVLENAGAA